MLQSAFQAHKWQENMNKETSSIAHAKYDLLLAVWTTPQTKYVV